MWFKVHWEGYGPEEDSWEPSDNLLTCQELVDRYWLERKEGYKKRGRKPVSVHWYCLLKEGVGWGDHGGGWWLLILSTDPKP